MKYGTLLLPCFLSASCFAQVLTNNGLTANILSGTTVTGAGLQNNSGSIINSGTTALKGVTVQSGSTLTNNSLLKISGAMGGTGNVASTNATIEINGTSGQTIPSGFFSTNMVKNLTTNNSAGITLNGSLKIKNTLLATAGSFNANGYLTLQSDSNTTALIDGSGAGSVTGNVTMQRYLSSGFGYKYISSPFQSSTVSELANDVNLNASFANVYGYNENLLSAGWVIDTGSSLVLNPMYGYAINCGSASSAKTIDISGVVNNGALSRTFYNHNRTYTLGFNLVGNPYPSPIDWNASSGWTKTSIDNAIYYFNHGNTDQYQGAYSTYINGVSSDGIASNIISSMQGFFIHVSNGSYPVTGTLAINNNARVNSFTPIFHKQAAGVEYPFIRISASYESNPDFADPAVIYLSSDATEAYEQQMDALKLLNTDERVPNFYSVAAAEKLAINAIPVPDETTRAIPLGLKLEKDAPFVFKASEIKALPAGLHVYFADKEKGLIQDLEQIPAYKLTLSKGIYEGRFYLLFSRQDKIELPGFEEMFAYAKGNSVFVSLASEKGVLQITNTLGQVVKYEELAGAGLHEIALESPAAGIYIVSLSTDKNRQSKKVLIGGQ